MFPIEWNALICFAARGDAEAVQCLVEGKVSTRADIREMSLHRNRINPDARGLYGDTALHAAAMNGHYHVLEFLIKHNADPNVQNEVGQTPLVCAAMMGESRCVELLLLSGAETRRRTMDGKNALDVASEENCRFLLRSLASEEEAEEASRRAEESKKRLTMTMIRWSKASMVDAFVSWSHYSLIPENKVVNLVERIDMLAKEITYQSSSTDIVHELNANSMEMCERRTQFVIYQGKRGLGVSYGSGHPLLLGLSDESAMERPDLLEKKIYEERESTWNQLIELEKDIWGLRSIYTARCWIRTIANLFDHCVVLVKKYHYILNDQRPASADTNLMVLQKAVLRLVDRLVKPHRTMLHGLRPRSFRSAKVLSSQALVNSKDFPPNFPGSPSDRRLYSSRFLHAWAWLVACNNPPGYLEIMDVQETLQRVANSLQIADDENVHYALYSCFKPEAEITGSQLRLHVQSLNLPIPPRYKTTMMDYYDKALCKVKGEPTTEVTIRSRMQQTSIMSSDDVDVSEAFEGSMLLEDVGF